MSDLDLNTISLTKALLENVTQTIYERGREYFEKEAVKDLRLEENQVLAKVEGREDYSVEISFKKGALGADCDCPYMLQTEEEYCKHIMAVAIAHDKKLGLALPILDDLENTTIEEIPHLQQKMNQIFRDPLNADLDILARYTDFGSWVRPHAKLDVTSFIDNRKQQLNLKEILYAFRRISSLENKYKYDPYFCAGEVTAIVCKTLDVLIKKSSKNSYEEQKEIFYETVVFYYQIYLDMIDGSDGIWQIVQARMHKMFGMIKKFSSEEKLEDLRERLNEKIEGWGDIFNDLGLK